MIRTFLIFSLLLLGSACATNFTGEPYFPGGPAVCFERCEKVNMEMASFIYAGEFATACVCQPRRHHRDQARTEADITALVAVVEQMRTTQATTAGALGAAGAAAGIGK